MSCRILNTSHGVTHFTSQITIMPPRSAASSNTDRPNTRSKNVDAHPGTAAQDALRVKAPRRDPMVIQKEKDAAKERKELKIKEKEAKKARDDATKRIADDFHAQQATEQASDNAEMPQKNLKSKGRV